MYSKISVIGQGRAGKSTLIRSILGYEFEELDSTVGVAAKMYEVNEHYIQGGGTSGSLGWNEYNPEESNLLDEAKALMVAKQLSKGPGCLAETGCSILDSSILHSRQTERSEAAPADDNTFQSICKISDSVPDTEGKESSSGTKKSGSNNEKIDQAEQAVEAAEQTPVSEQQEATGVVDIKLVQKFLKTGVDRSESLRLLLEDFGGQDNFYELYSILLSQFSMYVIVFNMEWLHTQGSEEEKKQAVAYLRHWLHTAGVYCKQTKIFLVGTHKDIVKSASDHESISETLHENFSSLPCWHAVEPFVKGKVKTGRGVLNFFPVDNKLGNNDSVIVDMMLLLEQRVRESEHLKHTVPFPWMSVIDHVETKKQENTLQMSFQEFSELCRQSGIPSSKSCDARTEIRMVLDFLDKLGLLMYHSSVPSLVILRPSEFLFPYFTKIICDFKVHNGLVPEHDLARKDLRTHFLKLQNDGVLSNKLLCLLWKTSPYQHEMKQLMVSLELMIPILDAEDDEGPRQEETEKYLVPSILPKDRSLTAPPNALMSALVIFGEKEEVRDWQRKSFLSMEDISKQCFVPAGIFSRLICSVASQCQQTEPATKISEMTIKQNLSTFTLRGKNIFTIIKKDCYITVHITKGSGFGISEMLQGLLRSAVESFGSGFDFLFLVPSDSEPYAIDKCTYFTLLSGNCGINSRYMKNLGISIGPSEVLENHQIHVRFGNWILQRGLQDWYHFFFSYRWNPFDIELTMGLYNEMGFELVGDKSPPRCFLDKMRLETGGNFVEDFSSSLITSRIAVLFMSSFALERMTAENINPEKDDNVLLEWTLILELRDLEKFTAVVPVLIGDVENNSPRMGALFASNNFKALAEIRYKVVNDEVERILKKHNIEPSPRLHNRTVKEVVMALTRNKGLEAHTQFVCSKSFSKSGDTHKRVSSMKTLIQFIAKELMVILRSKDKQSFIQHEVPDDRRNGTELHSPLAQQRGLSSAEDFEIQMKKDELEMQRKAQQLEIEQNLLAIEREKFELEKARLQMSSNGSSCCVIS